MWERRSTVSRKIKGSWFKYQLTVLMTVICCPGLVMAGEGQDGAVGEFESRIKPLLEQYCYDCHGEGAKKGDFAMDELIALGNYSNHSKEWDRVWKNIYKTMH